MQSKLGRIQLGKFQLGALGVSTLTGTFSATAKPTGSAVGSALALGSTAGATLTMRGSGGSPASRFFGELGATQLGRFWLGKPRQDGRDKTGPIVAVVGFAGGLATFDYSTRLVGTFAAAASPFATFDGHFSSVFFRGAAAPSARFFPGGMFAAIADPAAELILSSSPSMAASADPSLTFVLRAGQEEACISAPATPAAAGPYNAAF